MTRNLIRGIPVLVVLLATLVLWIAPGLLGEKSGSPATPEQPALEVYFSNPGGPSSSGPETKLVPAIDSATKSVEMAMYNLSLPNIADALLRAQQRSVRVRLVMESEAIDNDVTDRLQKAGIRIAGDRRQGLMHNKFTVIDGREVWTGSLNLTSTGAYKDNNNLLRIVSSQAAADYTAEFEEMYVNDRFGSGSPKNTPYPVIDVGGHQVEIYFSPDDGAQAHVVAAIRQARQRIDFLTFSFTADPIALAMIERLKAGVSVRGVFDQESYQKNIGSEYARLKAAGVGVRLDGNPGLMHHKVIVIDGQVVITGSYNFTAAAEDTNDENLVIINDAGLAAQYLAEFERVYKK